MLKPDTISQWIFNELRQEIIKGSLAPGESIRQDEVASRFEVSRMPVREALRMLEAEGLVQQIPHRGAKVANLRVEDVLELFELRAELEGFAARRSIPELSDEQVEDIKNAYESLERAKGSAVLSCHRVFHLSLYAASSARILRMIGEQLDASQRYHLRYGREEMNVSQLDSDEHLLMLECAQARNGEKASKIIRRHVARGGKEIATAVDTRDAVTT